MSYGALWSERFALEAQTVAGRLLTYPGFSEVGILPSLIS